VKETIDARAKLGPDDARRLVSEATTVIVAKGKKIVTFSMKDTAPDDDTLMSHMLGRSGTLRAPTVRKGRTLLVGFNQEAYEALF
jgi:arsenate reductase-like glutaredoxin family protein